MSLFARGTLQKLRAVPFLYETLRLGMVGVTILGRMKISGFLDDFLVRPQPKLGTARKY